jgi:hypothetical protein
VVVPGASPASPRGGDGRRRSRGARGGDSRRLQHRICGVCGRVWDLSAACAPAGGWSGPGSGTGAHRGRAGEKGEGGARRPGRWVRLLLSEHGRARGAVLKSAGSGGALGGGE